MHPGLLTVCGMAAGTWAACFGLPYLGMTNADLLGVLYAFALIYSGLAASLVLSEVIGLRRLRKRATRDFRHHFPP